MAQREGRRHTVQHTAGVRDTLASNVKRHSSADKGGGHSHRRHHHSKGHDRAQSAALAVQNAFRASARPSGLEDRFKHAHAVTRTDSAPTEGGRRATSHNTPHHFSDGGLFAGPTIVEEDKATPASSPTALSDGPVKHLFVEMEEMKLHEKQWRETCRWNYALEEDIVDGHWDTPHLPHVSVRALAYLRRHLTAKTVFFDLEGSSWSQVLTKMLRNLVDTGEVPPHLHDAAHDLLVTRGPGRPGSTPMYGPDPGSSAAAAAIPALDSLGEAATTAPQPSPVRGGALPPVDSSAAKLSAARLDKAGVRDNLSRAPLPSNVRAVAKPSPVLRPLPPPDRRQARLHRLLNMHDGEEAANILVSGVAGLGHITVSFARLKSPIDAHLEKHAPTRFVILVLRPEEERFVHPSTDIGRSMAMLLQDDEVAKAVTTATELPALLDAIDTSLSHLMIVPRVLFTKKPRTKSGDGSAMHTPAIGAASGVSDMGQVLTTEVARMLRAEELAAAAREGKTITTSPLGPFSPEGGPAVPPLDLNDSAGSGALDLGASAASLPADVVAAAGAIGASPPMRGHSTSGADLLEMAKIPGQVRTRHLFIEMDENHDIGKRGGEGWHETHRWNFALEEDLEGETWTKPHLPEASVHVLSKLRNLLTNRTVVMDLPGESQGEVSRAVINHMVSKGSLPVLARRRALQALMDHHAASAVKRHRAAAASVDSSSSGDEDGLGLDGLGAVTSPSNDAKCRRGSDASAGTDATNESAMLDPSRDEEAMDIIICTLDVVSSTCMLFARLHTALDLGCERHAPVRFLLVMFGPPRLAELHAEIGKAAAVVMLDEVFLQQVAHVDTVQDFHKITDEFLANLTVMPHTHLTSGQPEPLPSPTAAEDTTRRRSGSAASDTSADVMTEAESNALLAQQQRGRGMTADSVFHMDSRHQRRNTRDLGATMAHELKKLENKTKGRHTSVVVKGACAMNMDATHAKFRRLHSLRKGSEHDLSGVIRRLHHRPLQFGRFRMMEQPTLSAGWSWPAFFAFLRKYSVPLVFGCLVAVCVANLATEPYDAIWHFDFGFHVFHHTANLHLLINDVFMAFFFGLAAKEIAESALPGGSLNPIKKAVSPLVATVGGVVLPIAAFFALQGVLYVIGAYDSVHSLAALNNGWAIPTATDISLAWMVALIVFGRGHPAIDFLLLVAVADDAIGLAIIAIFYGDPAHPTHPEWLGLVVAACVLAYIMRRKQVMKWYYYVGFAGPIAWVGLVLANVHPALALVPIIPFLPAERPVKKECAEKAAEAMIDRQESVVEPGHEHEHGHGHDAEAPLFKFEEQCQDVIAIGMFFFAFANAGVLMDQVGMMTLALMVARVAGKLLGIYCSSALAARCGAPLPVGMNHRDLLMVSFIASIGMTVTLFLANQAFSHPGLKAEAKMSALFAFPIAGMAIVIGKVVPFEKTQTLDISSDSTGHHTPDPHHKKPPSHVRVSGEPHDIASQPITETTADGDMNDSNVDVEMELALHRRLAGVL